MSILAFIHIIISSSVLLYALSINDTFVPDVYQLFNDFVKRYNKSYAFGTSEYKRRQLIFQETLNRINRLNKYRNDSNSAMYGITQFSDLTPTEFENYVQLNPVNTSKVVNQVSHPKKLLRSSSRLLTILPKKMDWRNKHVITPVRNQEKCGACWAFSTVQTIETMYALKTGVLEEWSVQQVIDCAGKPNLGCEGGDTCLTIEWLYQDKIKLVLAKDYPFDESSGNCRVKTSSKTVEISSNYTCDRFVSEEELMLYQLAYHGPLVAAVDATGWQDYLGGIIQFHCDNERNHAVQIVGYDLTGDVPFYVVRNSWGTKFGNDGYLYIAFGKNMCGIAEEVSSLDIK